jgi:hypothetical protein
MRQREFRLIASSGLLKQLHQRRFAISDGPIRVIVFNEIHKDVLRANPGRLRQRLRDGIRTELSFTSFRHGGFTEGADSDLTDAELRAAGRHRSA